MATKKRAGKVEAPGRTATSRRTILFEQMQEQNRATLEAVFSLQRRMDEQFAKSHADNERRFQTLEAAIRQNSADIRQNSADIRQNTADIQKNSADIRQNSTDIQKNSADIERLEIAVRRLEFRLENKVEADIASLDARVTSLEKQRA